MKRKARVRWIAALLLFLACGLALGSSVSHDIGDSLDVAPTVTATITPSSAATPAATDGTDPAEPTPDATAGIGGGAGTGTGHGTDDAFQFGIAGDVAPVLEPGVTATIDLTLTNPNDRPIRVTGLSIAIARITAPRATPSLPCTSADFVVTPPSGATSLILPAHASRTLTALGLTGAQLPSLGMLNTAANQDGCKGATVGLSYGGTAEWGDP